MKSVDKRQNSGSNDENNEDSSDSVNQAKHSRVSLNDTVGTESSSVNQNNDEMNVDTTSTGMATNEPRSSDNNDDVVNVGASTSAAVTVSRSDTAPTRPSIIVSNRTVGSFGRMRSRSTTSYRETSNGSQIVFVTPQNEARIVETPRLSDSLRSAFQMSHNIVQVLPNLNNISLPDYLPQIPNISIPSITMPTISMPTISMPSMPNLSMPNISMPSMNINIPSISEFMNFQRRNNKTWAQLSQVVRESRRRFVKACKPNPFDFNYTYNANWKVFRIYFLACVPPFETSLYYCDVPMDQLAQLKSTFRRSLDVQILEEDEDQLSRDLQSEDAIDLRTRPGEQSQPQNIPITSRNRQEPDDRMEPFFNMDLNDVVVRGEDISMSSDSTELSTSDDSIDMRDVESGGLLIERASSPTPQQSVLEKLQWRKLIYFNRNTFDSTSAHSTLNNSGPQSTPAEESNKRIPAKPNNLPRQPNKTNAKGAHANKNNNASSTQDEDLTNERKRIVFSGLTSYSFHQKKARFVYTVKNIIYWFEDREMLPHVDPSKYFTLPPPYLPKKIITSPLTKMNPTFCSENPDLIAFVADHDVWVCDLVSGLDMRLTNCDYGDTSIMAGNSSFIMQEEFSRYSAFWWRPLKDENDESITLLVEFVDESMVDRVSLVDSEGRPETYNFPRAGTRNARSSLKLVHFNVSQLKTLPSNRQMQNAVKVEDLPVPLEVIFDEFEYLVRVGWYNRDAFWAQLLNRRQNKLVIVLISITNRFPAQIIWDEERTNHWYNSHDTMHFYKQTSTDENGVEKEQELVVGSQVTFLWSSELTGFRHLYKVSATIVEERKSNADVLKNSTQTTQDLPAPIMPTLIKEVNQRGLKAKLELRPITYGNWEVGDAQIWVDEQRELVYFMGNKESPVERHLYVVSTAPNNKIMPRRLTKEDFTHSVALFSAKHKLCISFQSNLQFPPYSHFFRVNIPEHAPHMVNLDPKYIFLPLPEEISLEDSADVCETALRIGTVPQLFEYKRENGELIYGCLIKPDFMEPGYKYPVYLEIYGGPGVQLVTKSFKDVRQHRRHLVANEGYIVVFFDSRGSKNRGVNFEKHIYKRLGQVELQDQIEALQWLAVNTDFMDMSRVAIHGWSYGGYLSLMAMANHSHVFKCAIAGAPVTNWKLYDTAYTERYMGLPDENEEGYKRSSVIELAQNFPDEPNRLMIIHGLMDENVHFVHTSQLINALATHAKPYTLSIYPSERHSLRKLPISEHYETTLLHFLQQNL